MTVSSRVEPMELPGDRVRRFDAVEIYAKLEVRDRASAVAAGYQRGLLTP